MPPVQPPDSSVALPLRALDTLSRRFGTGQPLSCEPVTQGLLNRGYHLVTTRGRYFLKHHLDGDPRAIERQHRATVRLGSLGLPVVPAVADPHGSTVAVIADRCLALHPWVEGRHRNGRQLSVGQSKRLGALLGVVHQALDRVMAAAPPPTEPAGGHPPLASADPEHTHELIDELLTRVRARQRPDRFDALSEYRLRERRELLKRHVHRRPPDPQASANGWVHGDFHPFNLLYRTHGPVEPVAIVDWDRLGRQPRAEEAVRAAAIFFVRPDGTLPLPKVRAYARAYRRTTDAGPTELAAAVHRVWWERLNDFWMLRWRYQLRDCRTDPQFPAASALVVWWTARYEAVRRAFCD